jgi:hypothetical protein
LKPGPAGYNLALLWLTVAIDWVESLLNFINHTYAELIQSNLYWFRLGFDYKIGHPHFYRHHVG